MKSSCALAIFVKTPGLSPVKTRLAASIGQPLADQFYDLSIKATKAVAKDLVRTTPGLSIFWSVAEANAVTSPIWRDFPCIFQGEGSLGRRLAKVYHELLQKYDTVCFIGADSPHLSAQDLKAAISRTSRQEKFVIGPTVDGGFYFFGGSRPIPNHVWESVEYSSSKTCAQLKSALSPIGTIETIDENFDIDTIEDLLAYRDIFVNNPEFLPEQKNLISWVKSLKWAAGA